MEWAINLLGNGLCKAHPERHELMAQRELRKRVIWFYQKESQAKHVHGGRLNVCLGEVGVELSALGKGRKAFQVSREEFGWKGNGG